MSGTYDESAKKRIRTYFGKMEQLNLRIPSEKKAEYVKKAEEEGMSLRAWVMKRLDAE